LVPCENFHITNQQISHLVLLYYTAANHAVEGDWYKAACDFFMTWYTDLPEQWSVITNNVEIIPETDENVSKKDETNHRYSRNHRLLS
jgi:hypothetical protein